MNRGILHYPGENNIQKSHLSIGKLAFDKLNRMWVIAVSDAYLRADEIIVRGEDTVADWQGNERFPDDDPVVDALMLFHISEGVVREDAHRYTYPRSRLHIIQDVNEQFWDNWVEEQ